jgi:hypothetical protein
METITKSVQSSKFNVQGSKSEDRKPKSENEILAENGFYWREKDGVKILVCRALEENGFVNGFSTRLGGVSDFPKDSLNLAGYDEDSKENIAENRRRFLSIFEKDFQIASCWQVHGADIRIVKNLDDAKDGNYKTDALVSSNRRTDRLARRNARQRRRLRDLQMETDAGI